jgi:hypothetical protein
MVKSIPHISEEYYCNDCNDYKDFLDVNTNWKCPICGNYVQIRIVIGNTIDQSCFRIPVSELNSNDIVLLHRNADFNEVLGITNFGDKVFLNIKEYGSLKMNKDDTILKLNGGWYH